MGEFHHSIDDKQRLIIPSKFRDELGDTVIITRGIESCLFIYSEKEWDKVVSKLKSLPFTKKDARSFTRLFLSGATDSSFDKQGRIKITKSLKDYAELFKDCVVIGVNDRLEVWSEENWNKYFNENSDNLSEIAEKLFETDFEI